MSYNPGEPLSITPQKQLGPRWSAVILAVYILLTLALTYPLALNLFTAVPNDIGDPLLNTWILAWDSHALLTAPLNLFNANIFYPIPDTLAYSEHLFSSALLALPLQLVSAEPIAAYNFSLLLTFPLAALGMYLFILRQTRQRRAAFLAGLIFAFAPYRFAAIAHLQLLTFQWLPFALLSLDLLLLPPQIRELSPKTKLYSLFLVIFLLLQLLASWYLAVYTLIILGFYLLFALLTQRLTGSYRRLTFLWFISFFLLIPFIWPYLSLLEELRAARPLSLAQSLAAVPTDFIAAAPFNRIFGPLTELFRQRPGFTEENTLFIGFIAPLLALLAVIYALRLALSPKRRHLHPMLIILPAVLLITLALTFPGPYAALAQLIPASTIVRVPPRWIIPAWFALSGLAAFGWVILNNLLTVNRNNRRSLYALTAFFLLICLLLIIETFSVPLPLAPVENRAALNPAYHWLAGRPGPKTLVELPLHSAPAPEYPEVKRLYASTLGWWQLVNGYSGYTPPRQPHLAQALANFPDSQAITALQTLTSPLASPPLFLLVHPNESPFDRRHWEDTGRWQAERNPVLQPLGQFNGDYLYQILPSNPARFTGPPLAVFGPDRSIQLVGYQITPDKLQPTFSQLTLYWHTTTPLPTDSTIFIHLCAPDGFVRSQADGPPVSGHYPTGNWQPGEIIQDIHPLPNADLSQFDHLAVGLYHPATGQRLPAFDATGQRLTDDALILPLP